MSPPLSIFQAESFDRLPGWSDDDHAAAFDAFRQSAFRALKKPYRSGSLGISAESFVPAFAEARAIGPVINFSARRFFENHFRPFLIRPDNGSAGFVTGFYEPQVRASRLPTDEYCLPVYARPPDLIDIDDDNRPKGLDASFRFGRMDGDAVGEYFDRRDIETSALQGLGIEIAWLADKVDLFFVHVQGAARLVLPDGETMRITYAAKSGHPFTGPGGILAKIGEIPLKDVTMQSIRGWFAKNPDRIDEILWQNRSFIFFKESDAGNLDNGPIAAAKVPLTAGRSMAVDRLLHTFATPFFIDSPTLDAFGGSGFRRLMIAQDTGSAIIGPARGDLFAGSGDSAGEIAGVIRHSASFHVLVPLALAESLT